MNQKKIKAFTLVELIVVITILAILWTIAFLSFQGYSRDARDSVRLSDLSKMMTSLELFKVTTWFYPEPTLWTSITYSWSEVWNQWVFWDSVMSNVVKLNKKPVDPLTWDEYTYSRLNTTKEYELWVILEWDLAYYNPVIMQANAWWDFKGLIKGTYNWAVVKVSTWSTNYVLAVPTIISSWFNPSADLLDIIRRQWLVFSWRDNIPASYNWDYTFTWWFDFHSSDASSIVLYEWDIWDLSNSWSLLKDLTDNMQLVYAWTEISWEWIYENILSIDSSNEAEVSALIWILVNNHLWWTVVIGVNGNNNWSGSVGWWENPTLPIIISTSPTWTEVISPVDIWAVTNKDTTCKFDTSNVDYDTMANTFTTTWQTAHTYSYSPIEWWNTLYVVCKDWDNNYSSNWIISFTYTTGTPVVINFIETNGQTYVCNACD